MKHVRVIGWSARLLVALTITGILTAPAVAAGPQRLSAHLDSYVVVTASPAHQHATGYPVPYRPTADRDKPDDNVPTWPFAVGTIAAVAAGAWWAMRRRP
ncbi:hypothetical protein F0Q45_10750 [Mycobacterium simiae]|uniref:Uncharacterized protein n=1 Tax=Mycobacterium simiae TaxID=1784 RepID=A0A5B1BNL8_MYCSI|nr:hypothetical protein [Mycobacterium simiae]KAA1250217.1 hypothetical protein F0Q45_10750 [Mycobacterium simiae]